MARRVRATWHKFRQIVLIHVGKVVKISVLLGHGCKLAGLDGGLGGDLGEELRVDIAYVRHGLGVGDEGRLDLLHVHLIPVDRSEERVRFKLDNPGLPATNPFFRLERKRSELVY